MENLFDNGLILLASVFFVWAIGFFVVAIRSTLCGASAHESNQAISKKSIVAAVRGEMNEDLPRTESRRNYGLAMDLKTGRLVSQSRLSEEATDEVFGVKV